MTPKVVIAGRPNVGKSMLVNRIVGRRIAVVEENPGVTRDRKVFEAEWSGIPFELVDTGGWLQSGDALDKKVSAQAEKAMKEATVILIVTDVTTGVTEEDRLAANMVHKTGTKVLLVVNKVDDEAHEIGVWEFMGLGFGLPNPISAMHGRGTGDLLDKVVDSFAEISNPGTQTEGDSEVEIKPHDGPTPVRIAIVGRPNVGKSTLFNRLIGEERSIVHDMPGTTRDAIDTVVETKLGTYCFIDTAGMRRPNKAEYGTESYSVIRALEALDKADVALLVIDSTIGATHQDQRLAERIGASGCPAVVVLNKWELIDLERQEDVLAGIADRLAFLGMAPVLKVSAATGLGVHRLLPALGVTTEEYHKRVPTGALNRALYELQEAHPPKGARIRYGVQGAIDPPTFTLFTNGRLHSTYLRYVERKLREGFGFGGTPIKIRVRTGGGR